MRENETEEQTKLIKAISVVLSAAAPTRRTSAALRR